MIRLICGAAAITSAGAASAADYPRAPYATPYLVSAYNWCGPYLGGQLGYQWGSATNSSAKPSGIGGAGPLRVLEVLEPMVWHGARPPRLCFQQRARLRHARASLRRGQGRAWG